MTGADVVVPGADAAVVVRVRVSDGTQVNHAGTVYSGGETVELPEEEAARLIAAGIVTEQ